MNINNDTNNLYLLKLIYKWRKHLFVILISGIVISIFFSSTLFIEPKFKSFSYVYPSNLISYSDETVTEQMLQIFKSDDVRDAVVKKLDLIRHYEIDTTKRYFKTVLKRIFESNVSIKKTEYESVEIEVYDTDPNIACNIINEITKTFNSQVRKLQREKKAEVVVIAKRQMDKKKKEIDSLENQLNTIRTNYNILDIESQVKEATRQYIKTTGKTNDVSSVLLSNIAKKGGEFLELTAQIEGGLKNYLLLKIEYENAMKDLTKELTYTTVVNKPIPADKKSYPIRWVIVLITSLSSLFISLIFILFIENYKQITIQLQNTVDKSNPGVNSK